MARKKKLNKRVVVFLVIVTVIVLAGAVVFVAPKMPQDPEALAARARAAANAKNYRVAEAAWGRAIRADPLAQYYCEAADLQIEIAGLPETPQADRVERLHRAHQMLQRAVLGDPGHVEAQRMLADFYEPGAGERYLKEADRLLALVPDDHETYFKCAVVKADLAGSLPGEYTDPAIEDFRKALELQPENPQYWDGLAAFYRRIKRYDEARDTYEQAIAALPNDPQIRVSYAAHLQQRGDAAAAGEQVQEAIKRAPDSAVGYLAQTEIYRGERQLDKALATLEKAKQADPTDFRVYYMAAAIYGYQKEPEKAADAINEGVAAITARLKQAGDELPEAERRRLEQTRLQLNYELASRLLDQIEQDIQKKDELLPQVTASLAQIRQANPEGHHIAKIDGRLALLEGNVEQAIKFLEKADRGFHGVDGQVANMLIRLYRQNAPGKAEKIIDRYLSMPQHASNPGLLAAKASFEVRYRNYDKALQLVEKALKANPENRSAKALRGELLMLTGQETEIPEEMELNVRNLRVIANRASILWINDQRAEAIELMVQVNRRIPENFAVMQQLFSMYLIEDQLDKCTALLKDAQARLPDNQILKIQEKLLDEPDPEKQVQMRLEILESVEDPFRRALAKAMFYRRLGKQAEYMEQLRAAEKLDPNSPSVVDLLFKEAIIASDWVEAERYAGLAAQQNMDGLKGVLYWAQLHISKKEHPKAIEALQKASEEFPNSKRVLTSLGECYLRTEEYDKAVMSLEPVAAGDPSYTPALIGLARAAEGLGKRDDHVEWIMKAYRLAPRHPYVERAYMAIQEVTASLDESIARREDLLQKKPDDADNIFRLGQLYQRARQNDKAEAMYRKVWQHPDTDKLKAARVLVSFYRSLGRYTDGQNVLDELLAIAEEKVMAYVICGDFYSRFDPVAAKRALQKAIESDPTDERGYQAMAEFLAEQEEWIEAAGAMAKYLELRGDADIQEKRLIYFLIRGDQLDKAEQQLSKVLGRDPSDAPALVLKGMLAMGRKEEDKALMLFDRAIRENARQADAFYYRSQIYRSRGMIEQAGADLEEARRLSSNPVFAMDLASVMLGLGDSGAAQLIYSEILQQRPDYGRAIVSLLELYFQQRRWQPLAELLNDAKARFPGDPVYPYDEARMWVLQDKTDRAIAALEESLRRDANYLPAIRLYLASLIHAERYEALRSVVETYKNDPAIGPWVVAYRARGLAKQGQEVQADEMFIEALRQASENHLAGIVGQLVQTYGASKAAQRLEGWIPTIRPQDWRLYWQLASVHLMYGGLEEASAALLKAFDLADSSRAKALVNRSLGLAYSNMGKLDEAAKAYQSALEQLPNDVMAMNDLAYLYVDKLGRPKEAVALAQKAAAAMPTDGGIVDTYGWALANAGKLPDAEQQLKRAVQLSPYVVDIRYHLGWVYEQRGMLADAERAYRQAFEIVREGTSNPIHEVLRLALDRVRQKVGAEE